MLKNHWFYSISIIFSFHVKFSILFSFHVKFSSLFSFHVKLSSLFSFHVKFSSLFSFHVLGVNPLNLPHARGQPLEPSSCSGSPPSTFLIHGFNPLSQSPGRAQPLEGARMAPLAAPPAAAACETSYTATPPSGQSDHVLFNPLCYFGQSSHLLPVLSTLLPPPIPKFPRPTFRNLQSMPVIVRLGMLSVSFTPFGIFQMKPHGFHRG